MAKIIEGYTGKADITAAVIGEWNVSLYGDGDYVLPVGNGLAYDLISNNEIHVKSGMFVMQGRRGYIEPGTFDKCIIENGGQNAKRHDLIVMEYAKDSRTAVESFTTKVVKGVPGEVAEDPEILAGDIRSGALIRQMPLYRVKIDGLNVAAVEQIFAIGSVAAETSDPMETTEPGFAADALKTKEAINQCFQSASDGKKLVASAITGKGVPTASDATFQVMADNIKKIEQGAKAESGSGTLWVATEHSEYTATVTFKKPFSKTPTINFSASSDRPTECHPNMIYIKKASAAGFTIANKPDNPGYATIRFYWNATV